MRPCAIAILVAGSLVVPGRISAADPGGERPVMSFPRVFNRPPHRIVALDGAAREVVVSSSGRQHTLSLASEGPGLLAMSSAGTATIDTAVRVEIVEILGDGAVRATFSPGADGILAPGPAFLFRPLAGAVEARFGDEGFPPPARTQAIRALPDVIRSSPERSASDRRAAEGSADCWMTSMSNLRRIAMAMLDYHDHHGRLPPAAVIGPDRRPWHSWRVLILPHLDGDDHRHDIIGRYDFSQPWDSPHNLAVSATMPDVYRDPIARDDDEGSSYAVLVGKEAIFRPIDNATMTCADDQDAISSAGVAIQAIKDGLSRTILVVTVDRDRHIPWSKPEDIVVGAEGLPIGTPEGIGTRHRVGDGSAGLVAFADGSVRAVSDTFDRKVLEALVSRDGGEAVEGGGATSPSTRPGTRHHRTIAIVAADDGTWHLRAD